MVIKNEAKLNRYGSIQSIDGSTKHFIHRDNGNSSSSSITIGSDINTDMWASNSELSTTKAKNECPFKSFRYVLTFYILLGITLSHYSRSALNLASVEMVASNVRARELSKFAVTSDDSSKSQLLIDNSCPVEKDLNETMLEQLSKSGVLPVSVNDFLILSKLRVEQKIVTDLKNQLLVDWSSPQQGAVYAAGSIGAIIFGVPMSRIGEIYGTKWMIFLSSASASLHGLLLPYAARASFSAMMIFEIALSGMSSAIDLLAYTLLSNWLLPVELSFAVGLTLSTSYLGSILSYCANGIVLSSKVHWQWCFFLPGIMCTVWVIFWILLGSSKLQNSPFVSSKELDYIKLKSDTLPEHHKVHEGHHRQTKAPWGKILSDPTTWAMVLNKFTIKWTASVFGSLYPTYLNNVMHASVIVISFIGATSSIIGFISSLTIGYLCKSLIFERPLNFTITTVRKVFQTTSNIILAVMTMIITVYDCNLFISLVCFICITLAFNLIVAGVYHVPMDMSKEHCGLIYSISNTLAIGQAIATPISGAIIDYGPNDRYVWAKVWYIIIGQQILATIVFILFVDASPREYHQLVDFAVLPNREDSSSNYEYDHDNKALITD